MKVRDKLSVSPLLDISGFIHMKSPIVSSTPLYRLVSVICHEGRSAAEGHYTTVAQCSSGRFFKFDDSCVRHCSDFMMHVINWACSSTSVVFNCRLHRPLYSNA